LKFDIYEGVVLDRDDPKDQGRYYVYIPELQFNDLTQNPPVNNKYSGVWCYNCVGSNFIRYTETELRDYSNKNSFGSYLPLKPGTHVLVGFPTEDNKTFWNTGYILNLLTYEKPPNDDRDNFYLIMTTDKESWAFIDETGEQFAVSFHSGKSNVWGKEDVIQISKESGTVVEVHDDHITAFHNSGNYIHIDGDQITAKIGGSFIKLSSDHISLKSDSIYIQGDSLVAIEGGAVQIDDGVNVPDTADSKSDVAKPSLDAIKEINEKDEELHTKLINGNAS